MYSENLMELNKLFYFLIISLMRKKFIFAIAMLVVMLITPMNVVLAANDPSGDISSIVNNVVGIVTQVGAAIVILYVVWDGINIIQRKDDPYVKTAIIKDVVLLFISVLFLFRPDFIVSAVKFIANVP